MDHHLTHVGCHIFFWCLASPYYALNSRVRESSQSETQFTLYSHMLMQQGLEKEDIILPLLMSLT